MTRRRPLVGLLALTLALASSTSAHAGPVTTGGVVDDGADDREEDEREIDEQDGLHLVEAGVWAALELGIAAWYYWATREDQEVDWTNPSWWDKLTLESLRFDTNAFHFNAVRHPLTGLGDYQIARSNGFGMLGSTLFAFTAGVVWEYFVEYNEDPSLNDLVMNTVGGIAIGEPLYQIGQLWRGGQLSVGDRLRTAVFSPFAATQDLWRQHRTWHRPKGWGDFAFFAGPKRYWPDGGAARSELELGADIDVVRHRGFVSGRPGKTTVRPGAWSRVELGARLGDPADGVELLATSFRSRTTITGTYRQDADGDGTLVALGTAFTYHRDRLADQWDHVAFGHLVGPQVQLSRRGLAPGALALRWDLAGYVDFGMLDAHVFGPVSPLPRPPPYLSTLQVEGYYFGGGGSLETRLRAEAGAWHAELELTAHRLWSLDFADRVKQVPDISRIDPEAVSGRIPSAPHDVSDIRAYGHAQVGVRAGAWGVAATVDAAYRRGTWEELERATSDWRFGVVATANL